MPVALFAVLRTAIWDISTLCVPFASCGGPETTASSCVPALFRWYCCATCWAIELVTFEVVPLGGAQFDQEPLKLFPMLEPASSTTSPLTAAIRTAPRPT